MNNKKINLENVGAVTHTHTHTDILLMICLIISFVEILMN